MTVQHALALAQLAGALLTLTAASSASEHSEPNFSQSVRIERCDGLDVDRVRYLLSLELAVVAARAERVVEPLVRIACTKTQIEITVSTRDGGATLSRVLSAPPQNAPDRERVVALAASQALLGSWLFLVVEGEAPDTEIFRQAAEDDSVSSEVEQLPHGDQTAELDSDVHRDVESEKPPRASPKTADVHPAKETGAEPAREGRAADSERGVGLFARAGLGVRDWGDSWLAGRLGVEGVVRQRRFETAVLVGWAKGSSSRELGQVGAELISVAGRVGWLGWIDGHFEWRVGGMLGVVRGCARARTARAEVDASTASGVAPWTALELAASYRWKGWRLGIAPLVGTTLSPLRAEVVGETAVNLGGPFFSSELFIGYLWGES